MYKNSYIIGGTECTNIKYQIKNYGTEPILLFLTTMDLESGNQTDKLHKICKNRNGDFILGFLPNEERSVRTEPISIKDPFVKKINGKGSFCFILNHAEKQKDIIEILTRHLLIINESEVETHYPGLSKALQKYDMLYSPSFIPFETIELYQELRGGGSH